MSIKLPVVVDVGGIADDKVRCLIFRQYTLDVSLAIVV